MAFRRPASAAGPSGRRIVTPGRSVHNNVDTRNANTRGAAACKPSPPPPPHPYNTYENFSRRRNVRTFPISETRGRGRTPFGNVGRGRGWAPGAREPAANNSSTHDGQARNKGLLMLVQPKVGQSIESFTPSAFYEAACDVIGRPLGSRVTSRGGLLVEVGSAEAARKLLKRETLCGIAVDVSIPRSYQYNVGRISGVTKWYTDEEIADQLSSQGVIQARRVNSRVKAETPESEPPRLEPSDSVELVFMPSDERPQRVTLAAIEHDVEDCSVQVPQCFHCQRMGHVSKHCLYNTRCGQCGGPHPTEDCTAVGTVRCANCGQGHLATFENCPARLKFVRPSLRGPEAGNEESNSGVSKS